MKNDFENALEFIEKDFSENEIIEILSGDDYIKKSAVLLNLKNFSSNKTGELLIHNLTNQPGMVREICAFKISEISKEESTFLQSKTALDKIILALNDINPNVARYILKTLVFIEDKPYIFNNLSEKIKEIYSEILNKPRRGKAEEHIFTKKCFKIYWSLEAIKTLIILDKKIVENSEYSKEILVNILKDLSKFEEYTVREKVAQIVNLLPEFEISDIKNTINNDENYFVKRQGEKNENTGC